MKAAGPETARVMNSIDSNTALRPSTSKSHAMIHHEGFDVPVSPEAEGEGSGNQAGETEVM